MAKGVIKKMVRDRGFGFISTGEGGGNDVFFHVSSVEGVPYDSLQEGQAVEFEMADSDGKSRGPRAGSVRPV